MKSTDHYQLGLKSFRLKIQATVWLLIAALAAPTWADSDMAAAATDTKKIVQSNFVETAQKGVKLSGYVDAGYSYNFTGQDNHSMVAPRFATDTAQRGDFNLYAFKLALEKALTSENKAQAGFRADVMIGEDASYFVNRTPNAGYNTNNNSNTLFLEQAYASVRAPVGNGWDFQIGKFVSTMGYEVIERPANLNITYGMLFNVMPLYYTGLLSSYRFDDYLDGKLGVVNGSNSDNNTTTGLDGDGCAVLAALDLTAPGGNATWSNNFPWSTNAENDSSGLSLPAGVGATTGASSLVTAHFNGTTGTGSAFIYNSWGNWAPEACEDKLLLAFNTVLGTAQSNTTTDFSDVVSNSGGTTWWGGGAYLKYQFTDFFYLASRGEFLGGNNLAKISSFPAYSDAGMSFWEYTLTAGFNVIDNLLIRAEYRMDWGTNSTQNSIPNVPLANYGTGPSYYAGAEVVYSF